MDLSQEFLIDYGINFLGFMLGGVLTTLVYAWLRPRREGVTRIEMSEAPHGRAQVSTAPAAYGGPAFIPLGTSPAMVRRTAETTTVNRTGDRGEVFRLARTMLAAGASPERIRQVLPISEAELSLISMPQARK